MTDDPARPQEPIAPPHELRAETPPQPETAHSPRSALAVFCALGFLLLAAGLMYVWQLVQALPPPVEAGQFANLEARLQAAQTRLAQLEQRPAPPTPPPAPDLRPLEARMAALENRPPPPVAVNSPLEPRIAALEQRPADPSRPLNERLAGLEPRIAALEQRPADPSRPLAERVAGLERRIAQAEAQAGQSMDRTARLARLQSAVAALEAGQPLGDIPGAPAALARFAADAPPTIAALRLSFPQAAEKALTDSKPDASGLSAGARMWQRMAALVTVKQGDKVVVGPPAATVLGAAREKLEAGDLAGAVAALDGLDAEAARGIAPWRGMAQSLLDARAALAGLARG